MEDRSALACLPARPGQGGAGTSSESSQPLTVQDFLYTVYYIIYISQPLVLPTKSEPRRRLVRPGKGEWTNAGALGRGTRKQNNNHYQTTNLVSHVRTKSGRLAASASAGEGLAGTGQRGEQALLPSCWVTSWQLCLRQRKH